MHWCCFLFWFWYRFTLALLAHFNWLVSIYVNCVYFISWKSYDLLWFWMHLMLCICFKPLRAENYLIVWCNLINKRINRYPNNTYKEIYNIEYGKDRKSKVEREFDNISEAEASDRAEQEQESSSEDEENTEVYLNDPKNLSTEMRNGNEIQNQVFVHVVEASTDNKSQLYPAVVDVPVPPPRFKKQTAKLNEQKNSKTQTHSFVSGSWRQLNSREALVKSLRNCTHFINCSNCRKPKCSITDVVEMGDEEVLGDELGIGNQSGLTERVLRHIPLVRNRYISSSIENEVEILKPNFTNKRDLTTAKELARRENRDRKVLRKRLRARRKQELAIILKHEARQKVICNAIELLLQILRMITSFMILVGNVRKTFMFSLQSGRYANHNIGLMLLLRCTVFLDIFLFWTNIMWAYCLQWHLCCRLGLIKFWSWIIILVIIGSVFMLYPMSYIHDNLDFSWCRFQFNSTLAQYQPSW